MKREDKIKLCRVVAALILSDGHLAEEEILFLEDLAERMELPEEDLKTVLDSLEEGVWVIADAAELHEHGEKLLEEMKAAAMVDGEMAQSEADLISVVEGVLAGEALTPIG